MVNVGALRTTISLDSAQFQQSMAGVNRQLQSLKQEQKAVTSSGTGFARGVDELRKKQDVLSRTVELQQGKVKELGRIYEDTRKRTGENSQETQNAQTQYNKAVAEMNRTENALKGITEELNRQTNPWNRLSENMTNAGQKMQDVGKKMTSFGKSWSMRVTAPIVGMGALVLKTGMDFEAAMSNVQALSGATGDDLSLLESAAREMGATTTKSASDAADGLGYMALAGWETQEMLEGLEPILRLSEAGNMDLARASDLVTDSMSALGIEVQDLPAYLDNVAEASRSSNTSIDQLMQAYVTAGGNLNQFNIPLEESTALLGVMANNGIKGSEAGRGLNAMLINLTSGAGRAGTAMEELNISAFDSEGQFIGLEKTLHLVKESTKDMTDEQRAQYVSMIAGKEHMKTFQALMGDLEGGYVSLKDNVMDADGALNDIADTMQDNAKGNLAQLKSATEELSLQFAEHLIPVFVDVVGFATDLVQRFGELDADTQKNIITMAGLAAVVGPAALIMGNLTTAIGGVVKIGGGLAGMLGKVGGTALLGKIGALGLAGPVGLAVAGVGVLGGAIYYLTRDTSKFNEASFDTVRVMHDQIQETDKLIAEFEKLQSQNRLTTGEMLEYMDILTKLSQTSSPQKVEELTNRQDELLEKSGFTNKEMETFLGLNDAIIEKSPATASAISDQGNAYADNLQILKDLNEEKRIEMMMVAEQELLKALRNERDLLSEQLQLQSEKNIAHQEYQIAFDDYIEKLREVNKLGGEEAILKAEVQRLQREGYTLEDEKLQLIHEELVALSDKQVVAENELKIADDLKKTAKEILDIKEDDLENVNEQLKKIDDLKYEYEALWMAQLDINAEKGQSLKAIDEEIEKQKELKKNMESNTAEALKNTEEYRHAKKEIDNQITRLKEAKGELELINALAAETAYEKTIGLRTVPSIQQMNREIATSVEKRVNFTTHQRLAYATGTDYHPGGEFLAGEKGWELGRQGDRWEMLNFGMYNRPAGYQVFTHDESKRILSELNNIPGYATGARPTGEANRVVNRLNDYQEPSSQPVVIELHVTSEIDGRVAGQAVERYVTEIQDRNQKVREQFA